MKIGFKLRLAGTIVVGLSAGAGLSIYQASHNQAIMVAATSMAMAGGPSTTQAAGPSSQQVGGSSIIGVVERVGDREFTTKVNSSSTAVTVRFNDQTTIRRQIPGALSDVKPGQGVSVRGESDADGNIVAVSIQLVAMGADGVVASGGAEGQSRGQRSQAGRGDSTQGGMGDSMQGAMHGSAPGGTGGPAQGGAGVVIGTVDNVANNVISITRMGGGSDQKSPVSVTVSDKTTILKTSAAASKDIIEGTYVLAVGPRGADGVMGATSIEILPAEATQMRMGK